MIPGPALVGFIASRRLEVNQAYLTALHRRARRQPWLSTTLIARSLPFIPSRRVILFEISVTKQVDRLLEGRGTRREA
jgi:hypothetical protein